MEWSLSKMNRIEKAKTGISANDLKALLPLYGITDKKRTEELLDLARAARRELDGGRRYSDVAPGNAARTDRLRIGGIRGAPVRDDVRPRDPADRGVRIGHPAGVPQREHARRERRKLVELRTRRRDLLVGREAPKFSFVLDESVVHRLVGSPAVTSQQFRHLVSTAELPSVTIQIVPFTAGLHPGMGGAFEVVEFDDTAGREHRLSRRTSAAISSARTQRKPSSYLKEFQLIEEKSLGPADSVVLRKAAGKMG